MKMILFKAPLTAAMLVLLMTSFTQIAHADGVATDSAVRTEVVCDVGSYGQQNCHEITRVIPVHVPVQTALPDLNVLSVGLVAIASISAFGLAKLHTK